MFDFSRCGFRSVSLKGFLLSSIVFGFSSPVSWFPLHWEGKAVEENKCKSRPAQDRVVKVNLWKATNEHDAAIFYDLEVENSKWKIA